ncbi:MAG TPA: hypothetical protein VMY36_01175 [Patescibacteria group bacterium]|nr:hypothetical protein [Patescibacteria group bacterium]
MTLPEPQSLSGERKEILISEREKVPVVERKEGEIKPEVKDYLTKVETAAEIKLPQPVTDDQGQVIVADTAPQKVEIRLPLTSLEMKQSLQYKITDSLRWLAAWCFRLVKVAHGKFVYRGAGE